MALIEPALAGLAAAELPRHVAIVMDGNRRWARSRQRPVHAGHAAGLERAVDVLHWCRDTPIQCVTLFAFASANWARDRHEVVQLMQLAMRAVRRFTPLAQEMQVQLNFVGRRNRLPRTLQRLIDMAEARTQAGRRQLRIAVDYSSRDAIADAARRCAVRNGGSFTAVDIDEELGPPVDLLIRTGGERRLSDFLLWECANAELCFEDCLWPEFDHTAWLNALRWFAGRERRFGR